MTRMESTCSEELFSATTAFGSTTTRAGHPRICRTYCFIKGVCTMTPDESRRDRRKHWRNNKSRSLILGCGTEDSDGYTWCELLTIRTWGIWPRVYKPTFTVQKTSKRRMRLRRHTAISPAPNRYASLGTFFPTISTWQLLSRPNFAKGEPSVHITVKSSSGKRSQYPSIILTKLLTAPL